ncbi:MAG: hypothetical protein V1833_00085 [Elusimicrobiota bacterium]
MTDRNSKKEDLSDEHTTNIGPSDFIVEPKFHLKARIEFVPTQMVAIHFGLDKSSHYKAAINGRTTIRSELKSSHYILGGPRVCNYNWRINPPLRNNNYSPVG